MSLFLSLLSRTNKKECAGHVGMQSECCTIFMTKYSMFGIEMKTWQQCYILPPESRPAASNAGRVRAHKHILHSSDCYLMIAYHSSLCLSSSDTYLVLSFCFWDVLHWRIGWFKTINGLKRKCREGIALNTETVILRLNFSSVLLKTSTVFLQLWHHYMIT
jgi:hypothetical protein